MDFAAFEHDPTFVIEALRRGEIDYLENLSEAAEADFFRHLIGRDSLTRLAEHYLAPRKKEEVRYGFILPAGLASSCTMPAIMRSPMCCVAAG